MSEPLSSAEVTTIELTEEGADQLFEALEGAVPGPERLLERARSRPGVIRNWDMGPQSSHPLTDKKPG